MRRAWFALILLPILAVAALYFVPLDFLNPGKPGLASGRIDIVLDAELRVVSSGFGRSPDEIVPATTEFEWREGGQLHVRLVQADRRITVVLRRVMLGRTKAGIVLQERADRPPERRPLTGTITLSRDDWNPNRVPHGQFAFEVGGERWFGRFAPVAK